MGEMKIYLPEELDQRFRKAAMNAYGYGRGSISNAATRAILEWCDKHDRVSEAASEKIGSTRVSRFQNPKVNSEAKGDVDKAKGEQFSGKREREANIGES